MSSATQNQIHRLMKEIADLRKIEAQESAKEANFQAKINRANEAISRTRSVSTQQNKLREIERAYKDRATVEKKRAEISRKLAEKSKNLQNYEEKKAREDERERKKIADAQKRLLREREQHERRFASKLGYPVNMRDISVPASLPPPKYDFFVCHASEDKDNFVRKLAKTLQAKGAKVWYDEFTLKVGDSLRREIDRGLANSRFGIVILSNHFFAKEWPQRELDGLCSLEVEGSACILPIWHQISKDEVIKQSPVLADKIALNTSLNTIDEIADRLYEMIDNAID